MGVWALGRRCQPATVWGARGRIVAAAVWGPRGLFSFTARTGSTLRYALFVYHVVEGTQGAVAVVGLCRRWRWRRRQCSRGKGCSLVDRTDDMDLTAMIENWMVMIWIKF